MAQEHDWQYDLDEYIRQGEPDRSEKSAAWQTAIGLQDVDGLQTSDYLLETAKEHIEGKIDIATAQKRIYSYYEQRDVPKVPLKVPNQAFQSAKIALWKNWQFCKQLLIIQRSRKRNSQPQQALLNEQ
jgi:hypothetical protein